MSATDTRAVVQQLEAEWHYAFLAFKGAFDTPQMRREMPDDYSFDARLRLRRFDEKFRALLAALPEQPAAPQGDSVAGSGLPLDTVRMGDEAERAAFEAWHGSKFGRAFNEWVEGKGRYAWDLTQELWLAWQARASLGAVSVPAETASGARPQHEHAHPVIGVVLPSQSVRIGGEGEKL